MHNNTRCPWLNRWSCRPGVVRTNRLDRLFFWVMVLASTVGVASAQAAYVKVHSVINTSRSWVGAPWNQTVQSSLAPVQLDSGWVTGSPPDEGNDGTGRAEGYADYGRLGLKAEIISGEWAGVTITATFRDTWTIVPTDPTRIGWPGYMISYVTVNGSWEGWGRLKVTAPGGEQYAGNTSVASGRYSGTMAFETYVYKLGEPFEVSFSLWGQVSRSPGPSTATDNRVDYLHTATLTNLVVTQGPSIEYRLYTASGHNYGFGVPEPATLSLLALAGPAMIRRRSKAWHRAPSSIAGSVWQSGATPIRRACCW